MVKISAKAKMRVQIATDVLELLRLKRIKAVDGYKYLDVKGVSKERYKGLIWINASGESVVSAYEKCEMAAVVAGKNCTACAIGSLVVAALERYDEYTIEDACAVNGSCYTTVTIASHVWMDDCLGRYFSQIQLHMIESAFECSIVFDDNQYDDSVFSNSIAFGIQYRTPGRRLRAIMLNIIKNHGTFLPTVE